MSLLSRNWLLTREKGVVYLFYKSTLTYKIVQFDRAWHAYYRNSFFGIEYWSEVHMTYGLMSSFPLYDSSLRDVLWRLDVLDNMY